MAIQLTVKEGNSERSWDVIDGQQIDIRMSKGAQYALLDTHTGEAPDGLRVVEDHGQTKIYGSDNYPWVTLRGEDEDDSEAATTRRRLPPQHSRRQKILLWRMPRQRTKATHRQTPNTYRRKKWPSRPIRALKARRPALPCFLPVAAPYSLAA